MTISQVISGLYWLSNSGDMTFKESLAGHEAGVKELIPKPPKFPPWSPSVVNI